MGGLTPNSQDLGPKDKGLTPNTQNLGPNDKDLTAKSKDLKPNQNSNDRILITGGAGFIGSHLCERLLKEGYIVTCLDNFNDFYNPEIKEENISKAKEHSNYTLIRGDILDKDLLHKIFGGEMEPLTPNTQDLKPKKVVHLAAIAGVRASIADPQEYVDVDIKGTLNLLEIAKEYDIEQFIFASSSSVYGMNKKVPFSEDDSVNNQASPYAAAKRSAELFCKTYNHLYNIPITVLRFFTVYGPRQRPDMAIHKFTRLMMEGKPIPMYGDGSSERDYTYIDDCIDGIMKALENPFDFQIFNLGNSTTIKLKDLIDLIAEKLGIEPKIEQLPDQPGDVPITYADIKKAKVMLGYTSKTIIEKGIERFIDWYEFRRR